jgi:hypothetical protein
MHSFSTLLVQDLEKGARWADIWHRLFNSSLGLCQDYGGENKIEDVIYTRNSSIVPHPPNAPPHPPTPRGGGGAGSGG